MSTSVIVPVTLVGGNTERRRNVEAWRTGDVITSLRFFWFPRERRMRGMSVWSTGQSESQGTTIGTETGSSRASFTFQQGERITALRQWPGIWEHGNQRRAGHIRFTTSRGNNFQAGPDPWGDPVDVNVGSGILVGIHAFAGADVNSLGFVFLKPIIAYTITNVSYPGLEHRGNIVPISLDGLNMTNNHPNPQNWTLSGERSEEVSWSFSTTSGLTTSYGFEVSAGIPSIGLGASGSAQWEVSDETTSQSSGKETRSLTWQLSGILHPGRNKVVRVLTQIGDVDVRFEGRLNITARDGSSFSSPISGTFAGVSITDVQATIRNGDPRTSGKEDDISAD